jgi:hypothetical protein
VCVGGRGCGALATVCSRLYPVCPQISSQFWVSVAWAKSVRVAARLKVSE